MKQDGVALPYWRYWEMKLLRIPLRAVFYKEGEEWIAHCLEFDLVGDGATRKEALDSLTAAVATQVDATMQNGNIANLFSPAEGKFFGMFAAGKNIAVGELKLVARNVTIEGLESREYSEGE